MKLERQHDRERGDNHENRNIDRGENELWKPCQRFPEPRTHRWIVRVDEKDPIGEPTDKHSLDRNKLDQ
jgi:hypothetical protein